MSFDNDSFKLSDEQSWNLHFLEALVNHNVLINKSQLPIIKEKKESALVSMEESNEVIFRRNVTIKQFKKKIQDMKNKLKKTDKMVTETKKIILKDWERKL